MRQRLHNDFSASVNNGTVTLWVQPKRRLRNGQVAGVEGLDLLCVSTERRGARRAGRHRCRHHLGMPTTVGPVGSWFLAQPLAEIGASYGQGFWSGGEPVAVAEYLRHEEQS